MSAEDNALLNIVANAIGGDEFVPLSTRYVIASRVLDALRSNGFEVVKLPEPDSQDDDGADWFVGKDVVSLDQPDDITVAVDTRDSRSPHDAHDLAAALLAAANAAEGDHDE